jgi:hypothetical protein
MPTSNYVESSFWNFDVLFQVGVLAAMCCYTWMVIATGGTACCPVRAKPCCFIAVLPQAKSKKLAAAILCSHGGSGGGGGLTAPGGRGSSEAAAG